MAHSVPHPLSPLTGEETNRASDLILQSSPKEVIQFRMIYRQEPKKADLTAFLSLEHSGVLCGPDSPAAAASRSSALRPGSPGGGPKGGRDRSGRRPGSRPRRQERRRGNRVSGRTQHFDILVEKCKESSVLSERVAQFALPEGFEVVIEPWPYGGMDQPGGVRRYFQGLVYAVDTRSGNPDSNFYAFPLPIIPVMDFEKREIVRIDELATGGAGDDLVPAAPRTGAILDHCAPAEYVPELLPGGTRRDLKPLSVVQPEGPSFSIKDESLVEWQKWRFRVSFNPREGAVIHDVYYDDRSVLYRLSISEMTVPYADPRPPFHRKQAFDFGDGGIGHAVNNLTLGCDCLGVIKYFDGVLCTPEGKAEKTPRVICLHEQDNGIGWKHTNWRTGRAVSTRRRELVVQFIITLANYEYIFNYKFDQAGAINVETRATGIVSVVNIDAGKTAPWGTVVNPGALAQNHQHIFCVRIDPAIDGHENTVVQNESLPAGMDARTNPHGNLYEVLANPGSTQAHRCLFAQHHLWVTKYRDGELYAAGEYPLSSKREAGGVADMVARNDDLLQQDVVLWSCFGLTHNPRVEDWPVM
ncbi:copper amine oxidase [Verticillium alfalfae VaMs.102]|uniref:Amine oxidase n=1 Tax=Verticillium alfalfae (strain VaMs.102 / ATCC MYA-4576 / FGSC 10136) TaxID=526221 RepID=C9S560_VERA1|nr:copper amine oxidase [Verticillium alfalfae VaMs.102]EEY14160.1 copper amine oxidase [Verticillium alfalfae VaMs.102]